MRFVQHEYLHKYTKFNILVSGDDMSKTSAAVKNRYNTKAYDRIQVLLPKGYKEKLRSAVGESGSITAFIKDAIDKKLKEGQA